MRRFKFGISALAAVLLFAVRPAAAQTLCTFSGSGQAGTDCYGQSWVLTEGGWGIPGIGQSTIAFAGDEPATDFHITFIPSGSFDGQIGFGSDFDTIFNVDPFELANNWTVTGSGNAINFFAPAGTELDPGQEFFVNVQFLNGLPTDLDDVSFQASWTDSEVSVTPEPASMGLLATGLVGIAGAGLRRKRRP